MAGEPGVTVGEESTFKWNKEQTTLLIRLRGENDHLFTGVKNSATVAWRTILEKMGLQGTVTPSQARKKWDILKTKYKECKYPGSGEGVSGKPTAATWPWFALMDEVIGQRPSIRPPVLLSTLREDTPGPSSAVGDRNGAESDTDEGKVSRPHQQGRGNGIGMTSCSTSSGRACSNKGRRRREGRRRAGSEWTDSSQSWNV
ncbi:uncharacterized protein LOC120434572 [Oreochromis aureus]|uniref:uncharacterized protein LOC120434572 n=1 Tax=Oreochromis aureus TaxID=47969 RepID=UPI00195312D8|nr:uncharacterized protein LOC120434572 [Oreochromis aureus]